MNSPSSAEISPKTSPADASPDNWVDAYAPAFTRPYLRLMRADRPIGTWLLFLPCLLGEGLAVLQGANPATALYYAILFAIGSFVMRGAGCAYNDIVDRDFDAQVARTALRPIPAGDVSVRQALIFTVFLCLVGLLVLVQLNRFTILLGLSAIGLVAAYPFMKRITWWPQAWLGLTFNWGALVGYAALTGRIDGADLALFAACFWWTMGYDTIYAHQDKEDDALIGVKSSALALAARTKPALIGFYGFTIFFLALAGALVGAHPIFYAALLAPLAHFAWQISRLDIDNGAICLVLFKSNRDAGLLALAALLLAGLVMNA